jgi:hypothetical protein
MRLIIAQGLRLRSKSGSLAIFAAILLASSFVSNFARLTLLGLCDQLDEAIHWLNLLAFVIVKLWIVVPVDGRT